MKPTKGPKMKVVVCPGYGWVSSVTFSLPLGANDANFYGYFRLERGCKGWTTANV